MAGGRHRARSGTYPSAITFPSPPRRGWTVEQRLAELASWRARLATAQERGRVVQELLEAALRSRDLERNELLEQIAGIYRSPSWRVGNGLLRVLGARLWRRLRP